MKHSLFLPALSLAMTFASFTGGVYAQELATTNRDTQLRATGSNDAAALLALPKGSEVEIIERQGGFTRVKAQGKLGFIPVFHFTPKSTAAQGASGAGTTMRTSAATVGARGLSPGDFENIEPNQDRYDKFKSLRVSASVGQNFGIRNRLQSNGAIQFYEIVDGKFVPRAFPVFNDKQS
jgi:hypothetical protein